MSVSIWLVTLTWVSSFAIVDQECTLQGVGLLSFASASANAFQNVTIAILAQIAARRWGDSPTAYVAPEVPATLMLRTLVGPPNAPSNDSSKALKNLKDLPGSKVVP